MQERYRFKAPPNWPQPPQGWTPPPGWHAPAEWGPAPPNWQFWVRTGFWQPKYAIPALFALFAVLVLVISLAVAHEHRWSAISYELGYDRGRGYGETQALFSSNPLQEESKGLTCRTLYDINENTGFVYDSDEVSSSKIDEDDYYEGCKDGIDDGFESGP